MVETYMSKKPKHILVIRLSAMGDVAMTVPIIRQFVKQNQGVSITVLTRKLFEPFFRDIENVKVYAADVKGKHKGISGLYKLSKELKELHLQDPLSSKIDAVADLHNVLRSKILKCFFRKENFIQIDKGRAAKKALTTGKSFSQLKTTHQRYADVFEALGYKLDLSNPSFPKPAAMSDATLDVVKRDSIRWIGIAPFAAFKSKAYPLESMEAVIEVLTRSHKVVLFGGGQKEETLLNAIASKYENAVNLAGKLSISEEMDVISNLDIMLSMDSGNAHIASMLGIPVVSLWGVTHPYAGFSPFNQPQEYALLADRVKYPLIPSSIYGNKFPEGYENAIASIKPQDIVDKVESIILR